MKPASARPGRWMSGTVMGSAPSSTPLTSSRENISRVSARNWLTASDFLRVVLTGARPSLPFRRARDFAQALCLLAPLQAAAVALELLLELLDGTIDGYVHVFGFLQGDEVLAVHVQRNLHALTVFFQRKDDMSVHDVVEVLLEALDLPFRVVLQGRSQVVVSRGRGDVHDDPFLWVTSWIYERIFGAGREGAT